jgi:hypothetical protein
MNHVNTIWIMSQKLWRFRTLRVRARTVGYAVYVRRSVIGWVLPAEQ